MRNIVASTIALSLGLILAFFSANSNAANTGQKKVDFVHEVQPILRESCYSCHGPEKKKGDLRLDSKSLAMKGGESGPSIVPGNSIKSPLVQRLISTDDEER